MQVVIFPHPFPLPHHFIYLSISHICAHSLTLFEPLFKNWNRLYTAPMAAQTAGLYDAPEGVDIKGRYDEGFAEILTMDALRFVAELQRDFRAQIRYAMECRKEAKSRYNSGGLPGFDPATKFVREGDWTCGRVPPAVEDRIVEITGPVERKMIINALNSGAKVFMADFEDSLSPSWENLMRGQVNLRDAVHGTITFHDQARNRVYKLNNDRKIAKLFVRPRGWHLPESHIIIDGRPATGCLVDFGLYFFHNHAKFRSTQGEGFGPFFYLPKMEHSRFAFRETPDRLKLFTHFSTFTYVAVPN